MKKVLVATIILMVGVCAAANAQKKSHQVILTPNLKEELRVIKSIRPEFHLGMKKIEIKTKKGFTLAIENIKPNNTIKIRVTGFDGVGEVDYTIQHTAGKVDSFTFNKGEKLTRTDYYKYLRHLPAYL